MNYEFLGALGDVLYTFGCSNLALHKFQDFLWSCLGCSWCHTFKTLCKLPIVIAFEMSKNAPG